MLKGICISMPIQRSRRHPAHRSKALPQTPTPASLWARSRCQWLPLQTRERIVSSTTCGVVFHWLRSYRTKGILHMPFGNLGITTHKASMNICLFHDWPPRLIPYLLPKMDIRMNDSRWGISVKSCVIAITHICVPVIEANERLIILLF